MDASGTLTTGDTDITEYGWDYRNRLTSVEHFNTYSNYNAGTSNQIVTYAYDYKNRLIGRTLDPDGTSGSTDIEQTIYVHDGDQIAMQFDKTGTGDLAAGDLSHRYLWGQAVDQILADETVDDGGAEDVLWALTDHLNTVRDLVSYDPGTDTTTPEGHITYDAYGNITNTPAVDILFGFTGRLFDEDTGLQNNLNRWYDAKVGRWLSEDPIGYRGGDFNLYRYVGNSPLARTDPMGLKQVCGFYVWLYTGLGWCVEENVYNAAMEAAGEVVNCWWKCEIETHECIGGIILTATEFISGTMSLPGVKIPKLPGQVVDPFDLNRGMLRALARKVGWRKAELLIRSLSRNRALMAGAKGSFVAAMLVEAGISAKCGYSCGKQSGVEKPFVLF